MKTSRTILSLFCAAVFAAAAQAITVTLDTSTLTPGGTYYVDFQLNDASGNPNNSATLLNFNFGLGGSAGSDIGLINGASGDVTSGVSLTDSSSFNEFFQSFTAGSLLRFELLLTNNVDAPIPDIFGFAILDETLANLATFSPFADQLLVVELNGGELNYQTYAGIDSVSAPNVPDAGSTAMLVAATLMGLAGVRRRFARPMIA